MFHNTVIIILCKVIWKNINLFVNILGSKYAIVASKFQKCDFEIYLSDYEIAIGNSKGKSLEDYFKGRVDKAYVTKKSKNNKKGQKVLYIF